MPDASQQSDLSIQLKNDRERTTVNWDIAKPSRDETFLYQSRNGKMIVSRQTNGGYDPEPVSEVDIPAYCFVDFVPSEQSQQEPQLVFDRGQITVSCDAAGVSNLSIHGPGDIQQFSHLNSTAGDNSGSVNQA